MRTKIKIIKLLQYNKEYLLNKTTLYDKYYINWSINYNLLNKLSSKDLDDLYQNIMKEKK